MDFLSKWLPTSAKEMKALGWDYADVILVSGDAYVDHPSFGIAVIARLLQAEGLRVAVIPQPNWRDDLRDFKKLGAPRLFFGVSAGSMDSMVNHYTAAKRLRSDDAYTPSGRAGQRPDRAATVYSRILKQLFPHTPVVLGGIEASLRRLAHYDYWDDCLQPSILVESGADIVAYGMGDRSMVEIARALRNGFNMNLLRRLKQVAFVADGDYVKRLAGDDGRPAKDGGERLSSGGRRLSSGGDYVARLDPASTLILHSFEDCVADGRKFAENFAKIETESNLLHQTRTIVEPTGDKFIIINAPHPVMDTATLDRSFELPYNRLPHPRYDGKGDIPAWEMIKNSINIHRGCFGGCSFCTISAHQGKFITSRSEASVLGEVERLAKMPYFKGNISDLGGPSANMYGMAGRDTAKCEVCRRPSCLTPRPCANLSRSHARLLELYRRVRGVRGIKKAFVGSGIRYDLFDPADRGEYLRQVILHHTSGRLKVAPEHTEEHVLKLMRKPPWASFEGLHADFQKICAAEGLRTQLIPYFISSHPGCAEVDMRRLSEKTRRLHLMTEQVQDLTPTPMTLASVMFHTGLDPYTGEKLYVARSQEDKRRQKSWFFSKK
ncbi:MAG: YgiQ family radical SAM protein [Alistipes sp.]|jgi:uncharacterized radical SAM protein YgiQ|nr:YgiQ family radical SAM protein [Alistipes sp.]